jgi:hypothetical protein
MNSIDIHIRWHNEQDLVFTIDAKQDTIADIKQKVLLFEE